MTAERAIPPRPSVLALVGWTAFLLAVAWILLLGGGQAGVKTNALRSVSLMLIVIGVLAWAVLAWRRSEWRPRSAIWPAVLLPFAALLLSTLASPYPRLGLDYLAWATLLIALYLLLVRVLAQPYVQRRLGGALLLFGVLISAAYIGIVVAHWLEWWDLLGRFAPPMLRPSYAALLIGGPTTVAPVFVLLGVSAAAATGFSSHRSRLAVGILAVTTLGALFLTGSRAAWLALAVSTAIVGLGLLVAYRSRVVALVRDPRVRVGGGVVLIGVVVVGLVLAPALLARLGSSGDGGRAYYATIAQRMFEDAPLVGQGPGNWAAQRLVFTQPGEMNHYIDHAHNIYLQTLAETGLVGLVAGAIALLTVLWLVVAALRQGDPGRRRWAVAGTFVLIYLGVSFLFDSYAALPVVILLAALPVAFLDATARGRILGGAVDVSERTNRRVGAAVTVAVFVAAGVAMAVLFRVESLASEHQRAIVAIDAGDWSDATVPAAAAVESDPAMPPYQFTLGLSAAAAGDWPVAARAFESAALADDVPEAWLNLALAQLESGEPDRAVMESLERAQRVDGDAPRVALASAYLYDRLGLTPEADDAYAELLAAEPSVAADPMWREDPAIAPQAEAIHAAAAERTGDPWQLALMWGDHDTAVELATASADAVDDLVTRAWLGDATALGELQDRALDAPLDDQLTSWAARASANAGDAQEAARLRRLIDFDNESTAQPGLETRVLRAGEETAEGATTEVNFYGLMTHRRALPDRLLAQGLPDLVRVDLAHADADQPPSTTP